MWPFTRKSRGPTGPALDARYFDKAGRTRLHYAVVDWPNDSAFLRSTEQAEAKQRIASEYIVANATKWLRLGAEVNAIDDKGYTPLHFAASGTSVEVVQLLLGAGADVDAVTYDGTTPIYLAVRNTTAAATDITRTLLEHGADPTAENHKGHSAATFVARYGKPMQRELLNRYVADSE